MDEELALRLRIKRKNSIKKFFAVTGIVLFLLIPVILLVGHCVILYLSMKEIRSQRQEENNLALVSSNTETIDKDWTNAEPELFSTSSLSDSSDYFTSSSFLY